MIFGVDDILESFPFDSVTDVIAGLAFAVAMAVLLVRQTTWRLR